MYMVYKFFYKKPNWIWPYPSLEVRRWLNTHQSLQWSIHNSVHANYCMLRRSWKVKKFIYDSSDLTHSCKKSYLVHSSLPLLDKMQGVHGFWKTCHMQGRVIGPINAFDARNMMCKTWLLGSYSQWLLLARLSRWVWFSWVWVWGLDYCSLVVVWLW